MGNCLPCLAYEPKRQKSRSRGSIVPLDHVDEPEKGVARIKMVMTKKEAAQLLSKLVGSKDSAIEYIDSELGRSQGQCLSSDALGLDRDSWKPALESIPEC
ncbi:hypothetical protein COCNU_scaffold000561G000030 [Cocos nucifera]|nr:hypothetical protein [Cocos nucifera]